MSSTNSKTDSARPETLSDTPPSPSVRRVIQGEKTTTNGASSTTEFTLTEAGSAALQTNLDRL